MLKTVFGVRSGPEERRAAAQEEWTTQRPSLQGTQQALPPKFARESESSLSLFLFSTVVEMPALREVVFAYAAAAQERSAGEERASAERRAAQDAEVNA